jgi:hypothetical protein
MDVADAIDPDLIDLVIQLCTRIGMIMEDLSLIALDASRDGSGDRVAEIVSAVRTLAALAQAAEVLLGDDPWTTQ